MSGGPAPILLDQGAPALPGAVADPDAAPVSRRGFLRFLLGFSVVSSIAMVITPIVGFLVPTKTSSGGAATIPATIEPLVPALQNNLLLTVHVAVAIVAYGSFSIAFGAAILFLIQPAGGRWGLPKPAILDEISYKSVVIGFPFLTATIFLGALWADVAWGSYWSWDPKETASLVTWLIYATYLHARVVRGWTGSRAAILLMAGFGATLLTYFGNYFFGGLHSYAGLR